MMDFQVVVLGGVSKKLPLVSKELPKALLPVANHPVLSYVLKLLELSNLKDLIVVVEGEDAALHVGAWLSGTYADRLRIEVLQLRQGTASGGLMIKELNDFLDQLSSSENRAEKTLVLSTLIRKSNAQEMTRILNGVFNLHQ